LFNAWEAKGATGSDDFGFEISDFGLKNCGLPVAIPNLRSKIQND
jgi:hypothetical protein